jgi:hypothetical protein
MKGVKPFAGTQPSPCGIRSRRAQRRQVRPQRSLPQRARNPCLRRRRLRARTTEPVCRVGCLCYTCPSNTKPTLLPPSLCVGAAARSSFVLCPAIVALPFASCKAFRSLAKHVCLGDRYGAPGALVVKVRHALIPHRPKGQPPADRGHHYHRWPPPHQRWPRRGYDPHACGARGHSDYRTAGAFRAVARRHLPHSSRPGADHPPSGHGHAG